MRLIKVGSKIMIKLGSNVNDPIYWLELEKEVLTKFGSNNVD